MCPESNLLTSHTETPLTLAARIKKPARMIVALVNGGALLDYRTRDGVTAMHRGVQASNFEAVKTLLGKDEDDGYLCSHRDCHM